MKNKFLILIAIIFCIIILFFGFKVDFSLNDYATVDLEYGETYVPLEINSYFTDRLFKFKIKKLDMKVDINEDMSELGTYEVVYKSNFLFWNKSVVQTINVVDTTCPSLILEEKYGSYTLPNHEYEEEGYHAYDLYDGDLTDAVVCNSMRDRIQYSVKDSSGNVTIVERIINYDDPEGPVITLSGDSIIYLKKGDSYSEYGYSAIDNVDGDITKKVTVDNNVDVNSIGVYEVVYSVFDSWGNYSEVKRIVNVVEDGNITESMLDLPEHKRIYLTFDDGPGPYTAELLDILDKYNVKATFFVTNQYPEYRDMIGEEIRRGHSVGIHSYSHDYSYIYSSNSNYFDDLQKIQDIISEQGFITTILRFPGGSSNTVSKYYKKGIMSELVNAVSDKGYHYFDWNVLSGDAGETTDTKVVVKNVIDGCSNNDVSIVLQHDVKGFSVDAVEDIIQWGQNNGYTFLPLRVDSPVVHHGVNN